MPMVIEDCYIPNWLPHFGEDGNLLPGVKLSVDCPICLRKLAITEPENENEEAFSKLPCGHAFGHECINNWLHDCIQERGKFTCPTCRVQFKHEACGHQIVLGRINTGASLSSLSLRERLGPCGPEQKVPPFCFSCRASMRESGRSETSISMIEDVFLEMNRRRQHGALSASGGNNYVAPLHGYVPHIGSRQVQSALPTSPPVLAAPAAPQGWQGYPYPQPFYHNTSFARSEQQQLPTLQELQAQLPPGLAQGVNGTALGYADIQGLGSVAPVPQLQPYPGDNIPIDPALSAYDEEMEMNEEQLRQLAPPEQGQENGSHGNNQNQNQNQNQNRRHRQERQPHGTAQSSLRRGQPQAQQRGGRNNHR